MRFLEHVYLHSVFAKQLVNFLLHAQTSFFHLQFWLSANRHSPSKNPLFLSNTDPLPQCDFYRMTVKESLKKLNETSKQPFLQRKKQSYGWWFRIHLHWYGNFSYPTCRVKHTSTVREFWTINRKLRSFFRGYPQKLPFRFAWSDLFPPGSWVPSNDLRISEFDLT